MEKKHIYNPEFLSWFETEISNCLNGSENKELLERAWIAGYNEGYNYAYDW